MARCLAGALADKFGSGPVARLRDRPRRARLAGGAPVAGDVPDGSGPVAARARDTAAPCQPRRDQMETSGNLGFSGLFDLISAVGWVVIRP